MGCDLRRGNTEPLKASGGVLGLQGLLLGFFGDAGLPDDEGGLAGQGDNEGLVRGAEDLSILLLGEVESPENLPLYDNGNSQETIYGRKTAGAGISREIPQS